MSVELKVVEQRCRAVIDVLDGMTVTDVAHPNPEVPFLKIAIMPGSLVRAGTSWKCRLAASSSKRM